MLTEERVNLTLSLLDRPLCYFTLTPDNFTQQGRASGWERVKVFMKRNFRLSKQGCLEV